MLIRHAAHSDLAEWLRMRSALWPDCPLEDHHSEMQKQLDDPARYIVFVVEHNTGKLGGFLEASLRAYADGCRTSIGRFNSASRWPSVEM
jgi:aminoglycoside 6'-N-acetyltransferase I